jgi:hypothetical protein
MENGTGSLLAVIFELQFLSLGELWVDDEHVAYVANRSSFSAEANELIPVSLIC